MQHLEGSSTPILYIECKVLKVKSYLLNGKLRTWLVPEHILRQGTIKSHCVM